MTTFKTERRIFAPSIEEDLLNIVGQTSPYPTAVHHNRRDIADFALGIARNADKPDAADT